MRRAVFLAIWWAAACLADQNSAFQDGSSLSASANQGAFSGIGSGAAVGTVPAYGTTPAEAQFFQGGQGHVTGPGTAKVQGCATATPDADPIKRQECAAVNFLANNIQVRPQITITRNDPMILTAKANQNNAEVFFQSLGLSGGTGNSTPCTTSTQTTPAQYTTQTCSVLKEVGTQQCSMGRVVNIDTDANFQCDQTVTAYATQLCNKVANVTVTQSGSGLNVTPGQTLYSGALWYGNTVTIVAGSSDGVITIYDRRGLCGGSTTVTVPTSVRVYEYSSSSGAYCGCAADDVHSISCSGTSCSDYIYSACYPNLYSSISFTRPTNNIVITKAVTWDDQCAPYK